MIKEGQVGIKRGSRGEAFSFMLKASGCAARITSPLVSILIRPEGRMLQLVEHWLPKPRVAGSIPVARSIKKINGLSSIVVPLILL